MPPSYFELLTTIAPPAGEQLPPTTSLAYLPYLVTACVGGEVAHTRPVAEAWNLLRYAARLLDDVEDGQGNAWNLPPAVATNTATGLIFRAGLALNELEKVGVSNSTAGAIRHQFYTCLLQTCAGQHADLTHFQPTLAESWQQIHLKSGLFMGLICWSAARLANPAEATLAGWQKVGEILGTLDQIHDDVVDLWSREQNLTDLQTHKRWSLPLAYAMEVYPAELKVELQQLLNQLPHSETPLREKIIASGAALYLHVQTELLYRQAAALVAQLAPLSEHQTLLLNWFSACRLLPHE